MIAQELEEVFEDLKKDGLMYRMLQGDVGTGKTLVAALALAANYSASYQGVLMAPTDILARQHYEKAIERFSLFGVKIAMFSRFVPESIQKKQIEEIALNILGFISGYKSKTEKLKEEFENDSEKLDIYGNFAAYLAEICGKNGTCEYI